MSSTSPEIEAGVVPVKAAPKIMGLSKSMWGMIGVTVAIVPGTIVGLTVGLRSDPSPPPPPPNSPPPASPPPPTNLPVTGHWTTMSGQIITVTNSKWQSVASWGNSVYTVHTWGDTFAIMQNPPDAFYPNNWTKVEWHSHSAGGFSYCMTKYDAATAADALAFDSSSLYNTADASAGCNGFSHSVVTPFTIPIKGTFTENYGATITITDDAFYSTASYGNSLSTIESFSATHLIMKTSATAYNPNTWSKIEWHGLSTGGFSYCTTQYNIADATTALNAVSSAYNASDASGGCSGFGHTIATKMTSIPIAGSWKDNWGSSLTISTTMWGTSTIESFGLNFAILKTSPTAYYPNTYSKVEWHGYNGTMFSYCTTQYNIATAYDALAVWSGATYKYNTSDALRGCGVSGFGHTVATAA